MFETEKFVALCGRRLLARLRDGEGFAGGIGITSAGGDFAFKIDDLPPDVIRVVVQLNPVLLEYAAHRCSKMKRVDVVDDSGGLLLSLPPASSKNLPLLLFYDWLRVKNTVGASLGGEDFLELCSVLGGHHFGTGRLDILEIGAVGGLSTALLAGFGKVRGDFSLISLGLFSPEETAPFARGPHLFSAQDGLNLWINNVKTLGYGSNVMPFCMPMEEADALFDDDKFDLVCVNATPGAFDFAFRVVRPGGLILGVGERPQGFCANGRVWCTVKGKGGANF